MSKYNNIQKDILKRAELASIDPHYVGSIKSAFNFINKLDKKIQLEYYWKVFENIGKRLGEYNDK